MGKKKKKKAKIQVKETQKMGENELKTKEGQKMGQSRGKLSNFLWDKFLDL